MCTLLMADIHGNFAALRAILSTPEAQSCGRVISLGDQVNFGPESRKVVETLRSLGATMLMGCCIRMILPATTGRCCV